MIIRNFAKLQADKILTFPLLTRDFQLRVIKEIPFSPIFFLTTKQRRTSYEISNADKVATSSSNRINSMKFLIQLFPIGFGVITAQINFREIIEPEMCKYLLDELKCGNKKTLIQKYVNYLKMKLLENLFLKNDIEKIKTVIFGPKIRVNIISESMPEQTFYEYSEKILGTKDFESQILLKLNSKTNDRIAFHKKGLIYFTSQSLSKKQRNYFRKSIDYIMDLFFGLKTLIPLIPRLITETDSKNRYENFNRMIFTFFYTANPLILGSRKELISLLPTAGMRTWFRSFNEICEYSKDYSNLIKEIISRINEIRVDKWHEIISLILKENIPLVSDTLLAILKEYDFTIRDIITPKIQLNEENQKIIDFLLEKITTDYLNQFGLPTKSLKVKDDLGFCTLNVIEKALNISGRDHLEFKNKLDILSQVGFLETISYSGPGSRKDSVQYRASPNHPYVNNFLRKKLAEESISELKLK